MILWCSGAHSEVDQFTNLLKSNYILEGNAILPRRQPWYHYLSDNVLHN